MSKKRTLILSVALSLALSACGELPTAKTALKLSEAERAFADKAGDTARLAAPDPARARVLALTVESVGPTISGCGWVDLGPADGIEPFQATDFGDEGGFFISVPMPGRGAHPVPLRAAFERQQIFQRCSIGAPDMPPRPAGAKPRTQIDIAIADLWRTGANDWAIVETPGEIGYAAVARRVGGGVIISPRMTTPAEAETWTRGPGRKLAAEARARYESSETP